MNRRSLGVPGRSTTSRSWAPSNSTGSRLSMKAVVLATSACSCSNVRSESSYTGTSASARRALTPLAKSQAICTWRSSGNMSGYRRDCNSTSGSTFFSAA